MPAKQLKMNLLQVFFEMTTQRNGFEQNSCAVDQQACVFGSCECKGLYKKEIIHLHYFLASRMKLNNYVDSDE